MRIVCTGSAHRARLQLCPGFLSLLVDRRDVALACLLLPLPIVPAHSSSMQSSAVERSSTPLDSSKGRSIPSFRTPVVTSSLGRVGNIPTLRISTIADELRSEGVPAKDVLVRPMSADSGNASAILQTSLLSLNCSGMVGRARHSLSLSSSVVRRTPSPSPKKRGLSRKQVEAKRKAAWKNVRRVWARQSMSDSFLSARPGRGGRGGLTECAGDCALSRGNL